MSVTESVPVLRSPAAPSARLVEQIDRAADRRPDSDAVRTADGVLSYGAFVRRTDEVARELDERTAPGEFVGIDADRGPAALVAMVGALRAGRPFVFLDRRDSDAANAAKSSLLGVRVVAGSRPGDDRPVLGARPTADRPSGTAHLPDPSDPAQALAYAVHTSGSTGRPKCVLVRADPLTALISQHVERLGVGPSSRTLQFARLTFDGSVTEILWTLTAGACLVVVDEDDLVPGTVLQRTLSDHGVTHFKSTPFALTATGTDGTVLEHVVNGGGACRRATVEKWSAVARFHNAYGTTETTVCNLLSGPLSAADCTDGVPMGDPIGDGQSVLTDPATGRDVDGEGRGELVVIGNAVAAGYLTPDGVERFGTPQARRYRTGDLVERRAGGGLFFVERLDRQVKVRGFRLDPGEIETKACQHPGVDEAAVLVDSHDGGDDGERDALVCFYQGTVGGRTVREHLECTVEAYKVPSVITAVDVLPYTPNGKVDHDALRSGRRTGEPVAPAESAEDRVLGLVRTLTGADATAGDNFFDVGGDSASAVVLTTRLKEWGWVDAGVRDVLRAPDLGALAAALHERSA